MRRRRRFFGAGGCSSPCTSERRARKINVSTAACEHVRETWRGFEEFNIAPQLALEALFVRLRRELGGAALSGLQIGI